MVRAEPVFIDGELYLEYVDTKAVGEEPNRVKFEDLPRNVQESVYSTLEEIVEWTDMLNDFGVDASYYEVLEVMEDLLEETKEDVMNMSYCEESGEYRWLTKDIRLLAMSEIEDTHLWNIAKMLNRAKMQVNKEGIEGKENLDRAIEVVNEEMERRKMQFNWGGENQSLLKQWIEEMCRRK